MNRFFTLLALTLIGALTVGCEPKACLTIRAIDDSGKPVAGTTIDVAFEHHLNPNNFTVKSGLTDSNGEFMAECRTSGYVTFGAEKSGYYSSSGKWETIDQPTGGKWSPWNPILELLMRRRVNPIPLLSKKIEFQGVPNSGQASFDVVVGDWLPPHGSGITSDFRFEWRGIWEGLNTREGELSLSFSNPGDGLVEQPYSFDSGSELRLAHKAPPDGYVNSRRWREEFKNPPENPVRIVVSDSREDVAYFFRVRWQTNEVDGIASALYGKIEGDIVYFGAGRRGSGLRFKYYLNPTPNDRNLEYDGTNNLFEARPPTGR